MNEATKYLVIAGVIIFGLVAITSPDEPEEKPAKQAAAKVEPSGPTEAECRRDLSCWAERFSVDAAVYCPPAVERLALHAFEWTDEWLEPKFGRYKWADKEAGIVRYVGDEIRFQNGFGAWNPMIYLCDIDTNARKVVNAEAIEGRLP